MILNKKTKKYMSEDKYFCSLSIGLKDSNGLEIQNNSIVRIGDILYHIILYNFTFVLKDKLTDKIIKIPKHEVITIIGNTIE